MSDAGLLAALRESLVQRGAALVACADLAPTPADARRRLPRGVSIGVALASEVISGIAARPTDAYAREYERRRSASSSGRPTSRCT